MKLILQIEVNLHFIKNATSFSKYHQFICLELTKKYTCSKSCHFFSIFSANFDAKIHKIDSFIKRDLTAPFGTQTPTSITQTLIQKDNETPGSLDPCLVM